MSDYLLQRQQMKLGKVPPAEKKKPKAIPKKSAKKLAREKEEKEALGGKMTDQQAWYDHIMKTENPVCWETGRDIDTRPPKKGSINAWHASIAHILPKKQFKSVATHPLNYLILSWFGGVHAKWDASWTSAKTMKVWNIAMDRVAQIYPDIADSEKKYLPDSILKELEKRLPDGLL